MTALFSYNSNLFLITFSFCLLLINFPLKGQNDYVDSLKVVYQNAEEKEEQLEVLHRLIGAYFSLGPKTAMEYAHTFDSIATQLNIPEWNAKAKNNLGLSYYMAGNYDQAIEYLLQSLPIWESLKDSLYIGKVYNNIGISYRKRKKKTETTRYYHKALQYFKAIKDSTWIANMYNNLASIYIDNHELDSATHYFNGAIDIYTSQENTAGLKIIYSNIGGIYFRKKEYKTTLQYYEKALAMTKLEEDPDSYSRILSNIGHTQIQIGQFKAAKENLDSSLTIAQRIGALNREGQILENISALYEAMGAYQEALEYWRKSVIIKDSLFTQEKDSRMLEMLTKYETDKKQAENDFLLSQNQIKDLQLKNAQKQRIFFILGLLALGLVLSVIFYAFRIKQKSNKELEKKNQIISNALSEKEILLKEIHHRVKNNLQIISSLLSLQSRRVSDAATATAIMESRNRVRAMALIHQNLYREDNLTGVDASAYIAKLAENLFATYNIKADKIKFEKDIQVENVDIDTIIPFGLIINELISNALKYAFPEGNTGKIQVDLKEEKGQLSLKVWDNGIGLPEDFNAQNQKSFGYKLIKVFAKKMHAVLDIQSNEGTSVSLIAQI